MGLGLKAIEAGYRVLFTTAAHMIAVLTKAVHEGKLDDKLKVFTVPGGGDRELLRALDGWRAGMSVREIAADLYGARRVASGWHPDGDLRSKTRRRIRKARALMEHGYRELAAGRAKRRGGPRSGV